MIDLATLLVAMAAADVILAATLWIGAAGRPRDGLGSWIAALTVRASAFAMFASESLAADPNALVLAVTLVGLSLTLQAASLLAFGNHKLPAWAHSAALAGLAVPFMLLAGDPGSRILFAALAFGTALAVLAGVTVQLRAPMSGGTRALLIGSLALASLVCFGRALGSVMVSDPTLAFTAPTQWQSVTLVAMFAAGTASSCAYLLLLKERADAAAARLATLDPLTGAYNRRTFHETAERELARARRAAQPLSMIMLDLDHFKGINDRLGHLAGDDVLRRVVEAVQTTTRATDSVYRYGGEEFVVILPLRDREELMVVAERLRTAVLDLEIEHPANPSIDVVSVSIGATLIDEEQLDLSDEQWFWVVDRAMYAAKSGGRNQVRLATGVAA